MISILEAQKIVNRIAYHFQIEPPDVFFTKAGARRSWYYVNQNKITISKNADYDSILHEASHAISKVRGGKNHDNIFKQTLLDVVDYYYNGQINRYPWRWDYPGIFKFYNKLKEKDNGN